jgi:hypothetical protein
LQFNVYLYCAADDFIVIVSIEGQLAAQEQEHNHTHTPQISLFAVPLHRQHLKEWKERIDSMINDEAIFLVASLFLYL